MPPCQPDQPAVPPILPSHPQLSPHIFLQGLLSSAASIMRKGLSKNTLKAYDFAWVFFSSFCLYCSVNPTPVNMAIVCAFIVHCVESRKLQPASIKAMLVGIQFHLRCLDPSTISILSHPSIRLLLNGLKKDHPQGKDKIFIFVYF